MAKPDYSVVCSRVLFFIRQQECRDILEKRCSYIKKYIFGVDIGGTTVKMGLFQNNGSLLEKWEIPTRKENNGEAILSDVAKSILDKIEEKKISEEVEGIGVGVPSAIDKNGVIVGVAANLGWGEIDVPGELGHYLKYPIKAANDANVAALGEMWQGGARGHANVIMITLGTGVGGGVIVDGKVVAGNNGAAGEIGHITVNPGEKESCSCGRKGCLEQYASATGIVRYASRYLEENPDAETTLCPETLTSKIIFDAAKEGDEVACHIVAETGNRLGSAMATLACVMNPEVFVIGGGVSKAGKILIDSISRGFRKSAFHAVQDTEIVTAELGNDAGICGAAKLILDSQV